MKIALCLQSTATNKQNENNLACLRIGNPFHNSTRSGQSPQQNQTNSRSPNRTLRPNLQFNGYPAGQKQSNCFLVEFEFRFSPIEVQPICRQSSVVCLIHWRRDLSLRNARRMQSPK